MRWEMVTRNVAALVELPRLAPRELRALSKEEADRFRDAVRGTRFEALFLLLLGTGMRPSEALGLMWPDLDLEAGSAAVRRVLPRRQKGDAPRFEEPKTVRSRRVIPLPPTVVRALVAHRKRQAAEKLKAGDAYADHGLVFASRTGGWLDQGNIVSRHFAPAVGRAKLDERAESETARPALRLYDLRHSHVTLSLRAGEPVHVVSARVGHASARMTLDVYAHALPADQAEAPARLEAALFAP
jgi:integrase